MAEVGSSGWRPSVKSCGNSFACLQTDFFPSILCRFSLCFLGILEIHSDSKTDATDAKQQQKVSFFYFEKTFSPSQRFPEILIAFNAFVFALRLDSLVESNGDERQEVSGMKNGFVHVFFVWRLWEIRDVKRWTLVRLQGFSSVFSIFWFDFL